MQSPLPAANAAPANGAPANGAVTLEEFFKIGQQFVPFDKSPTGKRMVAEREASSDLKALRAQIRRRLNERLRPNESGVSVADLNEASDATRARVDGLILEVIEEFRQRGLAGKGPVITDEHAAKMRDYLHAHLFGAGELEYLFREPDVEDILINTVPVTSARSRVEVWTYRQSGKRREAVEMSPDEVLEIVNRNAAFQGRKIDPTTPILNCQMRNGSRLNAILDPVCDPYLSVTIRIHRLVARTFDDLVNLGTLTQGAASWLFMCVQAQLATVVGGGTGSGKTNLLNAIARVCDPKERIVVIEDTRELDLAVPDKVHMVTVESKDPERRVSQRALVANALRMRPDRIVLGEVRDGAAWDAIKAATTGHDGTLLTVHAEDASGVVTRLIRLSREAPETANLSEQTMKEAVALAFQTVVFLERVRMSDGSFRRFVTEIVELPGHVNDGMVQQKRLFQLQDGRLLWSGQWPHERTKRRLLERGFTEQHIQAALQGNAKLF